MVNLELRARKKNLGDLDSFEKLLGRSTNKKSVSQKSETHSF